MGVILLTAYELNLIMRINWVSMSQHTVSTQYMLVPSPFSLTTELNHQA